MARAPPTNPAWTLDNRAWPAASHGCTRGMSPNTASHRASSDIFIAMDTASLIGLLGFIAACFLAAVIARDAPIGPRFKTCGLPKVARAEGELRPNSRSKHRQNHWAPDDLSFTSAGCRRPNAARLGVVVADRRDRFARSSAGFDERGGSSPSIVQSVADPHQAFCDRGSIGNTTGTSRGDRRGESNPFGARPTTTGWRLRRNS